jgi:hypothetical protein
MSGVAVVDASALAAVVFLEPRASEARERLNNRLLVAPVLLLYESCSTPASRSCGPTPTSRRWCAADS